MPLALDTLVDAALKGGLIEPPAAARLQTEARLRRGADPVDAITRAARCPASALYRALAEARGLRFVDALTLVPAPGLAGRVPETLLRRRLVLPYADEGAAVAVAMADPDDAAALEAIGRFLGKPPRIAIAEPGALAAAIDRALARGAGGAGAAAPAGIAPGLDAAPPDATALLDELLKEAFLRRASDIHLEPAAPSGVRVRMRVDGHLQDVGTPVAPDLGQALVSRVKVLAGLDIAERRAPQDGGFRAPIPGAAGATADIRVASAPTVNGERATLRLLGLETEALSLDTLGLDGPALAAFRTAIRRPHGIVLLTGPTGSGKTTTLYAALREIARPDLNIVTVEDPVEYALPGISQLQVDAAGKVTFARALRALLRHDPDVMMVGEIRDHETADVALKAAMTGHLVLSTLHTSTAVGAVTRLVDLGCEPYLVGATLALAVAQRLVRRLCPRCRRAREARAEEACRLGVPEGAARPTVYEPAGCAGCLGTGYRGRIALFEVVPFDRDLSRLVARGADEEALEAAAAGRGIARLRADGARKALAGVTSVDEVAQATVE